MNYNLNNNEMQLSLTAFSNFLMIPSNLNGFNNTETITGITKSERIVYCFNGVLEITELDRICTKCGCYMHINNSNSTTLRHLGFGAYLTCIRFNRSQFYCPNCHFSKMQIVPFKANGHRITNELYNYTRDLLATGKYTNKQIAEITGLGKNIVKDIDLERLKDKYTMDGNKLIKPEKQARFLGIDEFKLHDGYKFATHIIDLETGHILWISHGKKKQVVYDFMGHVGIEWMSKVEAVACDMNSDFQEAFETCPNIKIVFDHFHIVKNFNEKVINEVRKDEIKRLKEEGNDEGAKLLKGSKYILVSNKETLKRKDKEASENRVLSKKSELFNKEEIVRKGEYENRYWNLINENILFLTIEIIKEKLSLAYKTTDEKEMRNIIEDIIVLCNSTKNKHFKWFGNLLDKHIDRIVTYATYKITSGKIEGINNKIKTLRRQGYGYPDDEYFFLKLFDVSRQDYTRNVKSHKICD